MASNEESRGISTLPIAVTYTVGSYTLYWKQNSIQLDNMIKYRRYSVANTRHTPSSPALTTTSPFIPSAAARMGPRCPLCSLSNFPVRASHVLRVLSADADVIRWFFGEGCASKDVIASLERLSVHVSSQQPIYLPRALMSPSSA